jgi:hypothetical protein
MSDYCAAAASIGCAFTADSRRYSTPLPEELNTIPHPISTDGGAKMKNPAQLFSHGKPLLGRVDIQGGDDADTACTKG